MDNPQLTWKAYRLGFFLVHRICVVGSRLYLLFLLVKKKHKRDFVTDYRCQVGKLLFSPVNIDLKYFYNKTLELAPPIRIKPINKEYGLGQRPFLFICPFYIVKRNIIFLSFTTLYLATVVFWKCSFSSKVFPRIVFGSSPIAQLLRVAYNVKSLKS